MAKLRLALVFALALAGGRATPPATDTRSRSSRVLVPVQQGGPVRARRALVPLTSGAGVAVLDLDSLRVVARVPTRPHPQDVVVSTDYTRAFVLEMGTTESPISSVAVLDLHRLQVIRRVELAPYRQPHWAQLSHDGRRLWIACAPDQTILEVDVPRGRIAHAWRVPDAGPWMFVVTPDQRKIFVAGFDSGSASVIERRTGRTRALTLSGSPIGIAASPDGREVWIGAARTDTIYVVDVASEAVIHRFPSSGHEPARIAFTPSGARVVVTNSRSNTVTVYDTRTRQPAATIRTGVNTWPKGLALTADGATAYVSLMAAGRIVLLDLSAGTVRGEVTVGDSPERLALFLVPL